MSTIQAIFALIGTAETLILLATLLYGVVLWSRGVFPALLRLGNGLAKRNIAIFATAENGASLSRLLLDSGLFKAKNILELARSQDIGVAERASVYLVFWPDWADRIGEI